MARVFLDANVLFSAAYRPNAGLLRLWHLAQTELVTSEYAAIEALRNLVDPEQRRRLLRLLMGVEVTASRPEPTLPDAGLPDKDRPILEAAVAARCDVLLTGDHRHFGQLFGTTVSGVQVLTPARYISRQDSGARQHQHSSLQS